MDSTTGDDRPPSHSLNLSATNGAATADGGTVALTGSAPAKNHVRPVAAPASKPRARESHSGRPGHSRRRRSTSGAPPGDDDPGPGEPPPPLPYRIAGPAGDDSAVRAALLSILNRRHPGTSWHALEPQERAA